MLSRSPPAISSTHRAELIAAFVGICRQASPKDVLRAIILRWPDVTFDELQRGMTAIPRAGRASGLRSGSRPVT